MAIFGGKRIAELEQELASVRARLAKSQQEQRLAEQGRRELEAKLRHNDEHLETCAARLDHLAAKGTRTTCQAPPVLPEWERVSDDAEPEHAVVRARYTIEGRPRHLQALELMFKMIVTAGEAGSTVWFDVMVDGDGGGRILIRRGEVLLDLTEDEQAAWFLARGELPDGELRDVLRRDGVVCVELV